MWKDFIQHSAQHRVSSMMWTIIIINVIIYIIITIYEAVFRVYGLRRKHQEAGV